MLHGSEVYFPTCTQRRCCRPKSDKRTHISFLVQLQSAHVRPCDLKQCSLVRKTKDLHFTANSPTGGTVLCYIPDIKTHPVLFLLLFYYTFCNFTFPVRDTRNNFHKFLINNHLISYRYQIT